MLTQNLIQKSDQLICEYQLDLIQNSDQNLIYFSQIKLPLIHISE